MLNGLVGLAKAAFAARRMRGEFQFTDIWWMVGMVFIAFLLLWYVLSIVITDLPKWW
jgi:hypothetical protein